jgi:hypothetical protein
MFSIRVMTVCLVAVLVSSPAVAQTSIYNSGGFEGFSTGDFSPQDNWMTTDLNQGISSAGIIQSSTTFAGVRALQVIGPNLVNDIGFSFQTFWFQDRTSNPFNPVLNGTPIVRTTWRQLITGTTSDLSQMPFVGVYFEGFNAAGVQQQITSVLFDNVDRITAVTTNGNNVSSAVIANARNQWLDFQVDLNFSTQRFSVWVNGSLMLNNVNFRNTNGPTNRLVEFGMQASAIDLISPPPTNDAFYDNYMIFAIAAVPEPGTYALIALVVAAAAAFWHHRRQRLRRLAHIELTTDSE